MDVQIKDQATSLKLRTDHQKILKAASSQLLMRFSVLGFNNRKRAQTCKWNIMMTNCNTPSILTSSLMKRVKLLVRHSYPNRLLIILTIQTSDLHEVSNRLNIFQNFKSFQKKKKILLKLKWFMQSNWMSDRKQWTMFRRKSIQMLTSKSRKKPSSN